MSGWIGVDLDRTLAHYTGWGNGQIGEPIPAMASRVRNWIAAGREVRIFTARVGETGLATTFAQAQRSQIQDWCEKHFGVRLAVTATKDFGMVELWDDRAVRVKANVGEPCCDHNRQ